MNYLPISLLSNHNTALNLQNKFEKYAIETHDGYMTENEIRLHNYGIIRIVKGNLPNTLKAVFIDITNQPITGGMFGGAFIHCSDSRYCDECKRVLNLGIHFSYPVPLHDRFEA